MTPSKQARRERGAALRARLHDKLTRALAELERGATVERAALTAGWSDPSNFSRQCVRRLGARPRAVLSCDWRSLVAERTATHHRRWAA